MDRMEIGVLIFGIIAWIAIGQVEASGNIGNRSYSIWYSTHFLIEKRGICKLIYFKPKHFERYTLYEVISFFASFLGIFVISTLGIFLYIGLIASTPFCIIVFSSAMLLYLSQLAIVIINDIGSHRDEKKKFYFENGKREITPPISESSLPGDTKLISKVIQLAIDTRNHTYFTIYNLWDSYYVRLKEAKKDVQKRNQVNLDYIEYFKNIEHLVVIKENQSGSLQLKIQK